VAHKRTPLHTPLPFEDDKQNPQCLVSPYFPLFGVATFCLLASTFCWFLLSSFFQVLVCLFVSFFFFLPRPGTTARTTLALGAGHCNERIGP
jgi:hypothetical protein